MSKQKRLLIDALRLVSSRFFLTLGFSMNLAVDSEVR